MIRPKMLGVGLAIKSGITAGAIVCYDNSSGALVPVWTPCSTYYPTPTPPVQPTPGVQWLSCNTCSGTRLADGQLGNATCDICYT
jgi:hypothetical protein